MALIRTCSHCNGIMNACYSGSQGWLWCCIACDHTEPLQQSESAVITQKDGLAAFEAYNLYRNHDFDKAAERFRALTEKNDKLWPFLWPFLLSKYSICYCSGEHTPVIWSQTIDATLLNECDAYEKLYANALRFNGEAAGYYKNQAQELTALQCQAAVLKSGYGVFISYSSHIEHSTQFGKALKTSLMNEYALKNAGRKMDVFFANDSLDGQTVNLFEAHIHRALSTAVRLFLVVAPGKTVGKRSYPSVSEWMRNEYDRFIHMHGKDGVRICLMPGADVSMLDPDMRTIQIVNLKTPVLEDAAKDIAKDILLDMAFRGDLPQAAKEQPATIEINDSFDPLQVLREKRWNEAGALIRQAEEVDDAKQREEKYRQAQEILRTLKDYRQADQLTVEIDEQLKRIHYDEEHQEQEYQRAYSLMQSADYRLTQIDKQQAEYREAAALFRQLSGYKAADSLAEQCDERLRQIAKQLMEKYAVAAQLERNSQYARAAEAFDALGDYEDSSQRANRCRRKETELSGRYLAAHKLAAGATNAASFTQAARAFEALQDYADASEQCRMCYEGAARCRDREREATQKEQYDRAVQLMRRNTAKDLETAAGIFRSLGAYADAEYYAKKCGELKKKQPLASVTDRLKEMEIALQNISRKPNSPSKLQQLNELSASIKALGEGAEVEQLVSRCAWVIQMTKQTVKTPGVKPVAQKQAAVNVKKKRAPVWKFAVSYALSFVVLCAFMKQAKQSTEFTDIFVGFQYMCGLPALLIVWMNRKEKTTLYRNNVIFKYLTLCIMLSYNYEMAGDLLSYPEIHLWYYLGSVLLYGIISLFSKNKS